MRTLVFLLIFANFLFFAYSQGYLGGESVSETARLEGQIQPERLRLMWRPGEEPDDADTAVFSGVESLDINVPPIIAASNNAVLPENGDQPSSETASPQVQALEQAQVQTQEQAQTPPVVSSVQSDPSPVPVSAPNGSVTACLLLGGLSVQDADALEQKAREGKLESRRRSEGSWWVFIPPLANKETADKKASELAQLGVKDFFIVSDGAQKFAISLGVFSQEEGAQRHLANLRDKGVRSARAEPRRLENVHVLLEIRGAAEAVNAFRGKQPAQVSMRSCR